MTFQIKELCSENESPTPGVLLLQDLLFTSQLSHGFDLQQKPDNQLIILILILSANSSTFPGPSLVCICPIGPSDPARDNSQRALSKICQDKGKETCSKVRDMCGPAEVYAGGEFFPR